MAIKNVIPYPSIDYLLLVRDQVTGQQANMEILASSLSWFLQNIRALESVMSPFR